MCVCDIVTYVNDDDNDVDVDTESTLIFLHILHNVRKYTLIRNTND